MNLKNYTSSVPANQSIMYIERELAINGARNIVKQYDEEGKVSAIIFQLHQDGIPMRPIKLPANIQNCEKLLMSEIRKPRPGTEERVKEQAERTAWKILYDWILVQMSLVRLGQADMMQVFLGYALINDNTTFYEHIEKSKFKMLECK